MTDFIANENEARWGPERRSSRINGLARLAAVLLGIAVLAQQTRASAAEPKAAPDVALSAVRDSSLDQREPAEQGGPVVLRGSRPVPPGAGLPFSAGSGGDYAPPGNEAFQPAPLYGSGWDTQYDFDGLRYVPTPQ